MFSPPNLYLYLSRVEALWLSLAVFPFQIFGFSVFKKSENTLIICPPFWQEYENGLVVGAVNFEICVPGSSHAQTFGCSLFLRELKIGSCKYFATVSTFESLFSENFLFL